MISHDNNLDLRTTNIILENARKEIQNEYDNDVKIANSIFVNDFLLSDQLYLLSNESSALQSLADYLGSLFGI